MIKCVVFDLDDTLYPEQDYVLSGFLALESYVFDVWGKCGFFESSAKFFKQGCRGNVFNKALEELGISFDAKDIKKMVEFYRQHDPCLSLSSDAKWILEYLRKKYVLALITDGYAITQRNKIKALGLDAVFDLLVISDDMGREFWKPSLKPYQKVTDKLQVEANECVYIGDNPRKDFITAKRLGWHTIHIERDLGEYAGIDISEEYRADCKIRSLLQIPNLLIN